MNKQNITNLLNKLEDEAPRILYSDEDDKLDKQLEKNPYTAGEKKKIARRTALGFAAGLAAMPALILGVHVQQAPRGMTQSADYSLKNRFATAYVADTPKDQQTWTEVHTVIDERGMHYYTTKHGYAPADGSPYLMMGVFSLLGALIGSAQATEAVNAKRRRLLRESQQQKTH